MMQPPEVELFDPVFKANPYPTYARLRSEAPLHRVGLPDGQGVWLVTRYDDIVAVLKDERFVKEWRKALTPEQLAQIPPVPEVMKPLSKNMLDTDPPDHERLRSLVSKAFTPRLIEVAINTLLRRMPNLRLKGSPESLTWRPGMVLRGLQGLPVEF